MSRKENPRTNATTGGFQGTFANRAAQGTGGSPGWLALYVGSRRSFCSPEPLEAAGVGGRTFKLAELCPPKREGSDAVLSASLQPDDGATSPHLRPIWRKGATVRPFVSRQPWFRGPSKP
jgi:hypothetical protein